ncbi:hypothetical protein V6U71_04305 [Sphingopyxis sp. J-6]|uniref:hypothetical protein n=1 Tax=Sphingopyxis sp. J-6 TaxID=3122054 RepID=UPI003983F388
MRFAIAKDRAERWMRCIVVGIAKREQVEHDSPFDMEPRAAGLLALSACLVSHLVSDLQTFLSEMDRTNMAT